MCISMYSCTQGPSAENLGQDVYIIGEACFSFDRVMLPVHFDLSGYTQTACFVPLSES